MLQLPRGLALNDAFKLHPCDFMHMTPVTETGFVWPSSQELPGDMKLFFFFLTAEQQRWFTSPSSWIFVRQGISPEVAMYDFLDGAPLEFIRCLLQGKSCFDIAMNKIPMDQIALNDMITLIHGQELVLDSIRGVFPSIGVGFHQYSDHVMGFLPSVHVGDQVIVISNGIASCGESIIKVCDMVIPALSFVLPFLGWTWIPNVKDDPSCHHAFESLQLVGIDKRLTIGIFQPIDIHASPLCFPLFTLTKCVMHVALYPMQCSSQDAIEVRVKLQGNLIWKGFVDGAESTEDFCQCINNIFQSCGFPAQRCVVFGKSVDMSTCIRDLARENCRLSFHFVACQRGGGAKIDHRNECKTALAKELLGHDFPLGGIDALVDRWIEKLGANRILKALQERHDDRRWTSLIELAKVHGLPYVPSDPVRTRAASIIQRAVRKAKPLHIKAEDFTLCEGFFTSSGDTKIPIVPQVNGFSTGVVLLSDDHARPWIETKRPFMQDAFAVVTLSKVDEKITPSPQALTFPAKDKLGRQVILSGFMWQLGETDVGFSVATPDKYLTIQESMVVSITVWKDEAPGDKWKALEKAFIRTVKEILGAEMLKIWHVWGRNFFSNSVKVGFEHATTAQCYVRVDAVSVEALLSKSGVDGVYTTAKSDNHLPHPDWNVIWMENRMACVLAIQKISSHSGIVRGRNSWGIRCHKSNFTSVSKEIRPDLKNHDVPIPVTHLYKVDPIPIGISHDALVAWGKDVKWNFRVVKKLGRSTVLVGSNMKPPDGFVAINGTVVLIRPVDTNKSGSNLGPQIAGPRLKEPVKAKSPQHTVAQSDLRVDPWAQYRPTNGGGTASIPSPAGVGGMSGQTNKAIEGPNASKFQAVDARFAVLESTIPQLQKDQSSIEATVKSQHEATQKQFSEVHGAVQSVQTHVQSAICDAAQKQEQKLGAQFDQIMAMLQQQQTMPSSTKRIGDHAKLDKQGDATMSPAKVPVGDDPAL